jgi:hypothetical protein
MRFERVKLGLSYQCTNVGTRIALALLTEGNFSKTNIIR